jgi:hypothetical protein
LFNPAEQRHDRLLAVGGVALATALPVVCAIVNPDNLYDAAAQLVLLIAALVSIAMVSYERRIGPTKAFIVVWYVLLGCIPCGLYLLVSLGYEPRFAVTGDLARSSRAAEFAAIGLPMFSLFSSLTHDLMGRLRLQGVSLSIQTLSNSEAAVKALTVIWLTAAIVSFGARNGILQIAGLETVGDLGGYRVSSLWGGALLAFEAMGPWISAVLMWHVADKSGQSKRWARFPALCMVAFTAFIAVFAGWKSPAVILLLYFAIARANRGRGLPLVLCLVCGCSFVLLIGPFVKQLRWEMETGALQREGRIEAPLNVLMQPSDWLGNLQYLELDTLGRGVSQTSSESLRSAGWFSGPWNGMTVAWGLEAQIPRLVQADKRDLNIGNFVAQTIGPELGLSRASDDVNSLALFTPCEVAANYGLVAGYFSFAAIGIVWSAISVLVCGPQQNASCSVVAVLVVGVMWFEAPLGHLLAHVRTFALGLAALITVGLIAHSLFRVGARRFSVH